ncbi:MAG: Ig-like domain-containing protein, partial [Terriglobales bacterium]
MRRSIVKINHPASELVEGSPTAGSTVSAFSGLLLLVLIVMPLFGCGGGVSAAGDPLPRSTLSSISVLPTAATIQVGTGQQLQVTAKDQNGHVMPGLTFEFSSSDGVATVSGSGLVTGLTAGTASIAVRAGGKSASASITVTNPSPPPPVLTQISVSPAMASIEVGQGQLYTVIGYDQFNNPMSGITFNWTSDGSSSVATVNGNLATGVSAGTVHITATALGISSAPASLTVLPPPAVLTTIAVTPAAPSILTGGTQRFTAVGHDQSGNLMSGVSFAWSSANQSVATVDNTGLATGLSVGTAQITASAQGVSSNAVTLTINRPASVLTSITVSPSSASLQTGSVQQFTAVGYDQYDNVMIGAVFTWTSSNMDVASVDGVNSEGTTEGVVTALAAGSSLITVCATGANATVSVTVTAPPPPPPPPVVTTINLLPGVSSIIPGGTQQLSVLAIDQNGLGMSGVGFTWTSSDPSVATIDADGLATGMAVGTTEISASAQGVNSNAVSLIVTSTAGGPLTITRLSPPMALAGSGDLIPLTITGTGLVTGALVNFGSNILVPTSVNPTAIT